MRYRYLGFLITHRYVLSFLLLVCFFPPLFLFFFDFLIVSASMIDDDRDDLIFSRVSMMVELERLLSISVDYV